MPDFLRNNLTAEEREEFLAEATLLPPQQVYRLLLGYSEARTKMLQADASRYIWPWWNPPNPGPPTGTVGNFLSFPGYPFAHMYLGWPEQKQLDFRNAYSGQFNILPLSAWANYDGYRYDYTQDPQVFRRKIIELKEKGIEVIFFVVTDAVDYHPVTPSNAQNFCNYFIPHIKDICSKVSLGYELNQVFGWRASDDVMSGHHMIDLSRYIRWNHSLAEIWLHLQPNWWGPHYEGGDEDSFWRNAPELNGILFQIPWDRPLAEGVNLALHYEGDAHVPGVAGRMQRLGKKFSFFEHTRHNLNRWNQARTIMAQDPRVSWIC